MEDDDGKERSMDPKMRLEEGEEIIEVDEETSAAVRMSLYGSAAPDSAPDMGRGMRELSPNVMAWRKGTRRPGHRKKRRPSYWDGDLEPVVRSPAARRVVSSPIKKDEVRSQQASIEFPDDSLSVEMQMTDHGLNAMANTEDDTILPDYIKMEGQELD